MAIETSLLSTALVGFLSHTTSFATGPFNKIGFDLDYVGRARQISLIEETARSTYQQAGIQVNIAVWNMHIREKHHFDGILETGLQPMGAGGGFRIVVFTGKGYIGNGNEAADHNWRVSGNCVVREDVATCGPAGERRSAWSGMRSWLPNWNWDQQNEREREEI